jgi:hypothetical protein
VNLRAPVFLASAFAAQLPPDAAGAVVNILDQRVWKLTPQFFSYTLAKAALHTATVTMAQALAPQVRVNAVGPGPTLMSARQDPAAFARQVAGLPLGTGPTPEDIAEAVLMLAEARPVTGQMIAPTAASTSPGKRRTWSGSASKAREAPPARPTPTLILRRPEGPSRRAPEQGCPGDLLRDAAFGCSSG